ncbi:hypothetical protein J2W36_005074, partial [Variovorax ginsengisoli]|nr:hypothetical protein [Variovorax ginsengisoli]
QNATSSEELAATAEEMSSQAEQLQRTMSFFKLAGGAPAARKAVEPRKSASAPAKSAKPMTRKPAGGSLPFVDDSVDESNFARY